MNIEFKHVPPIDSTFFRITCPLCESETVLGVATDEYNKWKDGALIQDAFPTLTKEQREMLISGTCETCWETMMAVFRDE